MTPAQFRTLVWRYYRTHGRHDLPWRKTKDVYRILVSEVMLQQTQVDRVIPFYKNIIKKFPTAKKLAAAPLADVLKSWQGLGYNRRAKMLHQAAKELAISAPTRFDLKSEFPRSNLVGARELVAGLEKLPGVGPYTARAVAAFAFNQNVVVIETNIRTVVIHHFFPKTEKVSDAEIENILVQVLPKGKSREWYSALMDYGAHLKRSGISHNVRSTTHVKQSKFAGSLREARGGLVRALAEKSSTRATLVNLFGSTRRLQMQEALDALRTEGLVQTKKGRYVLAGG